MMHEGIRPPKFREPSQQANLGSNQQAQNALNTTDLPKRPNRKPFGSMQLKLAHEIRPGFHGHWFNDIPGRVGRALEAGYEHVKDKDGKNVSRVVGTAEGGGALTAFLMEIPEEWYQEDIRPEQDRIDAIEETMRKGKFETPEQGYIPSQGIKIQQGK